MVSPRSVCRAEMDRVLIIRGWRPGSRTDFFYVGWPLNVERVRAPHRLKQFAIGSPGKAVRNTSRIRQSHFYRIRRRPLCLFGAWVLQAIAARAHIPEIPADKITLECIVVKHRSEGRVHVALRLPIAEPRSHRSRIGHGCQIQRLDRPGESRLWCMTKTARLVLIDREVLIEEQ